MPVSTALCRTLLAPAAALALAAAAAAPAGAAPPGPAPAVAAPAVAATCTEPAGCLDGGSRSRVVAGDAAATVPLAEFESALQRPAGAVPADLRLDMGAWAPDRPWTVTLVDAAGAPVSPAAAGVSLTEGRLQWSVPARAGLALRLTPPRFDGYGYDDFLASLRVSPRPYDAQRESGYAEWTVRRQVPAGYPAGNALALVWSNTLGAVPDRQVVPYPWGATALVGDWDGDGIDTPGHVTADGHVELTDSLLPAPVTHRFPVPAGARWLVGDFDGDGIDTFAWRYGNRIEVTDRHGGPVVHRFWYGAATDELLVGDFDGDGVDTLAARRGNAIHVRNSLSSGNADFLFWYGRAGEPLYLADLDGDGRDDPIIVRGDRAHARFSPTSGDAQRTVVLPWEYLGATLWGDFDGDGRATVAGRIAAAG